MNLETKAAEMYARGQVGGYYTADVYPVKNYTVTLPHSPAYPSLCTCPATVECSHIKAARLAQRNQPGVGR